MARDLKRNCLSSAKALLLRLTSQLLLQLAMPGRLRQCLVIAPAVLVAESPLLLLFVAYCLLGSPQCEVNLTEGSQIIHLLYRLQGQLLQNSHLPCLDSMASWSSSTVLLAALTAHAAETSTIQCILTDLLVSLIEREFPTAFLAISCIASKQDPAVEELLVQAVVLRSYGFLDVCSC